MHRPHVGNLMHRLIMKPVRRDTFTRFHHATPLADDELEITWLGTAGLALEARGFVLLIDPFVSRPGFRRSLTRPLVSDQDAIRRFVPRADAIACGHSHHDHIMDVPDIARLTGARVMGSPSTINLCRAHGLGSSQLVEVEAPRTVEAGPFRVTFRPSIHGKAIAGRIPMQGEMGQGLKPPLRLAGYKDGHTMGIHVQLDGDDGLSVFHLGSADFFPETIEGLRCDVLSPCLVGREPRPGFTRELVRGLRPRVVIPNHFDDFMRPLDEPMRELSSADLSGFRHELLEAGHATRLVVLDLLGSFRCSGADPSLSPRRWD
jgi:L-ascorbate metabolism protein UlaG (beta-lactamase superfamily)